MLRRALIPLTNTEASNYGYQGVEGFEAVVRYDRDKKVFAYSGEWPDHPNSVFYSYVGRTVEEGRIQEVWARGRKRRYSLKDLLDATASMELD